MISNRDCKFDYSSLKGLHPSLKDLVLRISEKNPLIRYSAEQALRHKFFEKIGLTKLGQNLRKKGLSLREKCEQLKNRSPFKNFFSSKNNL